jgi:hypothetical protein
MNTISADAHIIGGGRSRGPGQGAAAIQNRRQSARLVVVVIDFIIIGDWSCQFAILLVPETGRGCLRGPCRSVFTQGVSVLPSD